MTTDENPLRVGLIGAGMVAGHHLAAWAKIPEARVVAIADPDVLRARERAKAFEIEKSFDSVEQLILEMSPDALDIAAPVDRHGELCRLSADEGIAILCQKPLASTLREAREIVADVGDRVRFMVHENWRFRAHYRRIKTWLDENLVGTVGLVRLRVQSSGLVPDDTGALPALVRQPFLATMPRFLVFEVLIHHLDVLRCLAGDLSVAAASLTSISDAIRAEDTAVVLLEGPNHLPVLLEGCSSVPGVPSHVADHLEIIGSEGLINLSDTNLSLTGIRTAHHDEDFDTMYGGSFECALREFVAGMRANRPFETEASDNLEVLKLVEDVYTMACWRSGSCYR